MFRHDPKLHSPWIDLSALWDKSEHEAMRRHLQKKTYATHRPWNKLPDHVGVRGECTYAALTGLAMDWELRPDGDHGIDFADGTGVKASTTDKSRHHLILNVNEKHWCPRYTLAIIDEVERRGCLAGWATLDEMRTAPFEDFGYGTRRAIKIELLRRWDTLPSILSAQDVVLAGAL